MNKLVAILALTTLLVGCPKDWSIEAQRLAQSEGWIACHFDNEDGDSIARPDGFQCRAARCIKDGQILHQQSGTMVDQHIAISRGICQQSGTVCSEASRKPCAPNEVCILLEVGEDNNKDVQALCADD